jgi:hypothetical protein
MLKYNNLIYIIYYYFSQVIETIGQENVKLSTKQVNELIDFMKVEEAMKTEMKIEKALSKSLESKSKTATNEEDSLLIDDNLLESQKTESKVRNTIYNIFPK